MAQREKYKLTEKQEAFCNAFLIHRDTFKAALAVGYKESTARQAAKRMVSIPHVARRIAEMKQEMQVRTNITIDMVLVELWQIANADPADAFDENNKLKQIRHMPEALRKTIKSIETYEDYTEGVPVGETQKITFWDKTKALEMLCKHLGMFIDININKNLNVNMNQEQPQSEAFQKIMQNFNKAVREVEEIKEVKPISIKAE
jgi:phage terminase small subunit